MSKMIQIRNVPDPLHRKLKARAATAGLSLSDFMLRQAERAANTPTIEEMMRRIKRRTRVRLTESTAAAVRAERDGR